jgi:hypothetical protein
VELHFVIADATVGQNVKRGAAQQTMTAETRTARFAGNNSRGNLKLMNMAKPHKHPAL